MAYYDLTILGLFLVGNGLYVAVDIGLYEVPARTDIKRFAQAAGEQSNLFQLVTGMQEIKLNNCETEKRWEWELHPGETVQDKHQGLGPATISTARIGVF